VEYLKKAIVQQAYFQP